MVGPLAAGGVRAVTTVAAAVALALAGEEVIAICSTIAIVGLAISSGEGVINFVNSRDTFFCFFSYWR